MTLWDNEKILKRSPLISHLLYYVIGFTVGLKDLDISSQSFQTKLHLLFKGPTLLGAKYNIGQNKSGKRGG